MSDNISSNIEFLKHTLIRYIPWIKTKREDVKIGRSGALKPEKLGLICKINKCSSTRTGDLGMLPNHEA